MDADKNGVIQDPQESGVLVAQKEGKPVGDRVYTEEEIRQTKLFMVLTAIDKL